MKKYSFLALPFLFTSCTTLSDKISTFSPITITIIFGVLMLSMIGMFFYVARKRNQAEKTATQFSHSLKTMLNKIDGTNNKIRALEQTIERIDADAKYQKDPVWRDKILSIIYQELAAIYYANGDEDMVLKVCSAVIELDPSHMMSYYNRGTLYGNLGMHDKAIKDLSEAILLDSTYANSYNNRGMIYQKMGDLEKAELDYTYSLEVEKTPVTYYNRGNVRTLQDNKVEALQDYQTALMLLSASDEVLQKQIVDAIQTVSH